VFRYFGYLLIAIMALVLAGGVGLVVFGVLADRAATQGRVRLVAFDGVGPAVGPAGQGAAAASQVRFGAFLQDADYGRPVQYAWLIARLGDGSTTLLRTDSIGLTIGAKQIALEPGRHDFTVSLPDTHPRADVVAHGSLWALPPDCRVLWIDAEAIVPLTAGAGGDPESQVSTQATDTLQRLAVGRQPLYLVAVKEEDYASVRRILEASSVPPGPALWLRPGSEARGLAVIRRAIPNVDGAIITAKALADTAAKLKVQLWRVPRAGQPQGPDDVWREAVDVLSLPQALGRGAGEVK
jgi:hypothetical protein